MATKEAGGKEVATQDQNTEVSTANMGALPAHLQGLAAEHVGKGSSQAAEDNIVPLIYVLQAQSPQCNRRGPDYVEGAEAGAFWLRGSGLPAISGDEGLLFQPCFFSKDWIEWKPNRGGYVDRHAERPADAVETEQDDGQGGTKMVWLRPNGNIVVETRNHVGIIHFPDGGRQPYVLALSGSGHTVSRNWMGMINRKMIGEGVAPSWVALYRLKTKERSNAKGTWMTIDVADAGWASEEDFKRGTKLNEAFASGDKAIETPVEQAHDGGGGGRANGDEGAAM